MHIVQKDIEHSSCFHSECPLEVYGGKFYIKTKQMYKNVYDICGMVYM